MNDLTKKCLLEKIKFVSDLEKVILKVQTHIESIHYDVLIKEDLYSEYLVIEYKGGAKTARNCTGNSMSAIYQELGNYLTTWGGGADIEHYNNKLKENVTVW